ncbi:16 kDa beta-galactoside-binding lectin-like [Notamacropus eugenii]|uniref:16 kDa beta-galactoside-binding lectin-like n=1 Tax=Notamacropus eugenii TaxID=9315 RepID=UPI003B67FDD9
MPQEFNLRLNIQPGVCVKVKGDILANASGFGINLGKDEENIALHFNPRFNIFHDQSIIILNSKTEGVWGTEQREPFFPLKQNTTSEISITFEGERFLVNVDNKLTISFPNRLGLKQVDFMAVRGDFQVRSLVFNKIDSSNSTLDAF